MCEQTGIGVLRLHNTVASDRSDSNWLWYSSESIKGEPRSIFTIGYGGVSSGKLDCNYYNFQRLEGFVAGMAQW